jgi:hypothetical protein
MKNVKFVSLAISLGLALILSTNQKAIANDCLDRFAGNWMACTPEDKQDIKDLIEAECGLVGYTVIFYCPDGSGQNTTPGGKQQRE